MPTCARSECKTKLDKLRYRRDWCSYECWKKGQKEMREYLRRYRAAHPKPLRAPRTMADEEEPLGQPTGYKW
jgi:hypothetical protein